MSRAMLTVCIGLALACTQKSDDAQEPTTTDTPTTTTAPNGTAQAPVTKPTAEVVFTTDAGDVTAHVEVVRTQRDIRRGLMYRTHLPEDAGMLFLFKKEKIQSFWMKNTLISLDMIFIRADMTVAGVVANTVPQDKTSRFIQTPSQFVLEVNAGWAAKNKIAAGTKVKFVKVKDVPPGVPMGG